MRTVGSALRRVLMELRRIKRADLPRRRLARLRSMGRYLER
jgi:acetyl-CoA carboxylase alpha subunit